jgi:probable F420-dependent oxidoreductase
MSRMKVGVVLSLSSTATEMRRYAEIRALALQAEAAGFDSVWVFDHLFMRFPPRPLSGSWEGWSLLTALAEATQRVELGTLVLAVPFRNPVLLAKSAATVDEISGGRLILGLGAGWHAPEFESMGIPFDARVDRFEEALQVILPLLREGRVTFRGSHYEAIDAEIVPRGPRPEGPPILIGCDGPRMMRLAARYAGMWNTAWYGRGDNAELRSAQERMREACTDVGRDPATLVQTTGVMVGVSTPRGDDSALGGSPQDLADGLRGFAQSGTTHAICRLDPMNEESLGALGEGLQLFRESEG